MARDRATTRKHENVALPDSQVEEIVRAYLQKLAEGRPLGEIQREARFFRPEVSRAVDRELARRFHRAR